MELVRTLLADDHAVVRAGMRNALQDVPYLDIVGEVGNGPELMQALEMLVPECLLIDVTMPEFEPVTAIRQIRGRYPNLYILVVSAHDDDVYVQGLLGAGVNGYHLKDQPLSDLRLAVERILTGERWISSPLLNKLLHIPTAQRTSSPVPYLSPRQREILRLLAKGLDNRALAQTLNLSVKTVENHLTRLYRQINVQSRLECASYIHEHPELTAATDPYPSPESFSLPTPSAEQTTILLVDDNERYRGQLHRTISKMYPQALIYEASNTQETLQLTQQVLPRLMFIDIVLGNEDGIRCTRRVKAQLPTSRIILISAYPDREFHRRGLEAGATAFLDKKDLDAATLQQIIEDTIG